MKSTTLDVNEKPEVRGARIVVNCPHCGCDFDVTGRSKRWRARRGMRVFCSSDCKVAGTAGLISRSLMGHAPHPVSPEGLRRRIAANTGRVPWNKGQPSSAEHRRRQGNALRESPKAKAQRERIHAQFSGERSPHWKGGITPQNVLARTSLSAKEWRAAVMERDDFTCQQCGQRGGDLHAHHVKPFSKYPDLRWELSNGQTLCVACHRKTPTYGRVRSA